MNSAVSSLPRLGRSCVMTGVNMDPGSGIADSLVACDIGAIGQDVVNAKTRESLADVSLESRVGSPEVKPLVIVVDEHHERDAESLLSALQSRVGTTVICLRRDDDLVCLLERLDAIQRIDQLILLGRMESLSFTFGAIKLASDSFVAWAHELSEIGARVDGGVSLASVADNPTHIDRETAAGLEPFLGCDVAIMPNREQATRTDVKSVAQGYPTEMDVSWIPHDTGLAARASSPHLSKAPSDMPPRQHLPKSQRREKLRELARAVAADSTDASRATSGKYGANSDSTARSVTRSRADGHPCPNGLIIPGQELGLIEDPRNALFDEWMVPAKLILEYAHPSLQAWTAPAEVMRATRVQASGGHLCVRGPSCLILPDPALWAQKACG
ncbi:MAG: hypothetical protein AAGD07_02490 [Planctomycetota bacterium]